jgi:hypothetical protein
MPKAKVKRTRPRIQTKRLRGVLATTTPRVVLVRIRFTYQPSAERLSTVLHEIARATKSVAVEGAKLDEVHVVAARSGSLLLWLTATVRLGEAIAFVATKTKTGKEIDRLLAALVRAARKAIEAALYAQKPKTSPPVKVRVQIDEPDDPGRSGKFRVANGELIAVDEELDEAAVSLRKRR